jgi:hypothetical protein
MNANKVQSTRNVGNDPEIKILKEEKINNLH